MHTDDGYDLTPLTDDEGEVSSPGRRACED
jgi:hypothetical protein